MNNFEFKVGDRVIASDNVGEYKMRPGTIVGLWFHSNHPTPYKVKFDEGRCLTLWSKVHSLINPEKKIVITTDCVKITTATLYEDGKKVKTATAKCCTEDTFNFIVGAKLACERLSEPPKPKYYNGKVVCVNNINNTQAYTIGKVYEFIDGRMTDDLGQLMPRTCFDKITSFEHWNKWTSAKFIPLVED
jgi:hypothetical protein